MTSIKPCELCGCPYPNDHTLDCPAPRNSHTQRELIEALKDILADCDNALEIRTIANLDFAVEQSAERARAAIAKVEDAQ